MTDMLISTLPRNPNDDADPSFLQTTAYVTCTEQGVITVSGTSGLGYLRRRQMAGERIAFGVGTKASHYVDLTESTPTLKERPTGTWTFNKVNPATYEEVVATGVPKGIARYTGPAGSGEQGHDGVGSLSIGWTVPGTYEVTLDCFPFLPAEYTFNVGSPS